MLMKDCVGTSSEKLTRCPHPHTALMISSLPCDPRTCAHNVFISSNHGMAGPTLTRQNGATGAEEFVVVGLGLPDNNRN